MAVIYYFDPVQNKWLPITSGGTGGGTPGPQGPAGKDGKDGKDGESIEVLVQDTQPASAKPGTVWISNT
jgi:hypothetical protein